jgi:hypothetical protein
MGGISLYITRGYEKLDRRSATNKGYSTPKNKSCFYSKVDTAAERIYNAKIGKDFQADTKK